MTGHAYIEETTEKAKEQFYPYYSNYWTYVNKQRGMLTRMSRNDFEQMASPDSALFVVIWDLAVVFDLFELKKY